MPQSQKLNGVIRTARAVEMAVRLTESSTLAFAREDMKLEILPPGQEATRIMPRPIMGEIHQLREMARRQVKAGSRTSWHSAPSPGLDAQRNTEHDESKHDVDGVHASGIQGYLDLVDGGSGFR